MPNDQFKRRTILAGLGALGLAGAAAVTFRKPAPLDKVLDTLERLPDAEPMPVVFVGHGTPFGALDSNVWNAQWGEVARSLPRPRAILSISAHWLTEGASLVTTAAAPPMNYDVRGFPPALYQYRYGAPGSPEVAREVVRALDGHVRVFGDTEWGFDHGTWLVLKYMYPQADIFRYCSSASTSAGPRRSTTSSPSGCAGCGPRASSSSAPATWCTTSASAEARESPSGRTTGRSSSTSASRRR